MNKPINRCAIYTRKSTEEGLDQEFNSLDAQRYSGEAFIASQQHEGWQCLPDHYDDGGFTGGNTDRPALRRLLADIEAGRIDTVVVYKVDRLSRSLLDFTKILETFERHKVSFVSVTQQFNTATSMGRLMLNILLSFAQFEREMISERTRDKMAAARRKGKWAGGMPLLGYDVEKSKLRVNADEAEKVREIFRLYMEHKALMPVVKELNARGWQRKEWTSKKGTIRGGGPFTKDIVYAVLTNVAYIGKVRYKEEVHEGEHQGIVSTDVFEAGASDSEPQRTHRRSQHAEQVRGVASRAVTLFHLPMCHVAPLHGEKEIAVSLLRLPKGPAAGLGSLPGTIDSRPQRSSSLWSTRSKGSGATPCCCGRHWPRPAARRKRRSAGWNPSGRASNANVSATRRSRPNWVMAFDAHAVDRQADILDRISERNAG